MPPLYVYECLTCEESQELSLKIAESQPEMKLYCEKCKVDSKHRKILAPTVIRFKGPGWTTPTHGNK